MPLANDAAIHAATWEPIAALDLVSRLGTIACPVLILVGV